MSTVDIPSALLQKLNSGNVALFLGAGASIPAGLPNGATLVKYLSSKFSQCDTSIIDFMELCQDIEETPPYSRTELVEFIKSKLDLISITDEHKTLTKYDWSAIFTTNFDEVVETAYRTTEDRLKSCSAITKNNLGVNVSDRSKVNLFKVMGTLHGEDESEMVLSRSDYNHSIARRSQYFKLLGDYIKSGTILYVGYSFKDQIAKDVIKDVTRAYGHANFPWSYMVLREIPSDPKSVHFLQTNKIIPIQGDFKSFFNALGDSSVAKKKTANSSNIVATIQISGKQILIDEVHFKMYNSTFDFLYEENLNNGNDINTFLKGQTKTWEGFKNGWDFGRECRNILDNNIGIKTEINEAHSNLDMEKNRILYIIGMPGSGKTMLTCRLAYDYYMEGKGPVLLFDRNNKIDFKIISSFIEDVNNQFDNFFNESEKKRTIKPLLVFDDATLNVKDLSRLREFLSSRGRSAIILANGRLNEFEIQERELNLKVPDKDKFILQEKFTDDESARIINYLFKYKFITSRSERWEDLINGDMEKSIFATFYSFVHPSKKPLGEIIRDQYQGLSDLGRRVYFIVCCFSQFDIYVNIELVVRVLDISYQDYYDVLQDIKRIVFEEEDAYGNICYRTHHKIIAQKTIDFFSNREELYTQYLSILKACVLNNNKERAVIESFLIENFSKDSKSEFDLEQRNELFKRVCSRTPTRSLCHHSGLISIELEHFEEANKFLLMALDLPREDSELFRGESDQNILTSLGKLNSLEAIKMFKDHSYNDASVKLDLAEKYYDDAKHGDFPNAYAYHAHAHMWFQKSKIDGLTRKNDQAESVTRSLQIISKAHDNLSVDELKPIVELETTIWSTFENAEERVKELTTQLQDQYDSPNGYFIYASFLFRKAMVSNQYRQLYLETSLKILNNALANYPKDGSCLGLKCKVMLLDTSFSNDELFEALNDWYYYSEKDSAYLLYNYGRIAFVTGEYDISMDVFDELESGIGLGNVRRTKVENEILNQKTGLPEVFIGEVNDIYNKHEGRIKVTSLSSQLKITFKPVAAKFTVSKGATVGFNIGFNYRGPYAINVLKN